MTYPILAELVSANYWWISTAVHVEALLVVVTDLWGEGLKL